MYQLNHRLTPIFIYFYKCHRLPLRCATLRRPNGNPPVSPQDASRKSEPLGLEKHGLATYDVSLISLDESSHDMSLWSDFSATYKPLRNTGTPVMALISQDLIEIRPNCFDHIHES